jgi:spermidine synthase
MNESTSVPASLPLDEQLNSEEDSGDSGSLDQGRRVLLFASVFVIATCGLIYELITGAVASYLLGNSVTQYSLVIGLFLAAMGLGSYATKWINEKLLFAFIAIQILIGLSGGLSTIFLFLAFKVGQELFLPVTVLTLTIGSLVGMEIPLLIRILKGNSVLQVTVPQVLALDYIGALAASLLFPFFLLPALGLIRAALVTGLLNMAVAGLGIAIFRDQLKSRGRLMTSLIGATLILIVGLAMAGRATEWFDSALYRDQIIYAENSKYQRIVVTRFKDDVRLFLNGHLQFASVDEYRYHEALVNPVMSLAIKHPEASRRGLDVLILGGGDGLALDRVLDFPHVKTATVVDLDPRVVDLFKNNPQLKKLNGEAFFDKRVTVINADAFSFLHAEDPKRYDVMIIDLPDPGTTATNKLFTYSFYSAAQKKLTGVGGLVTQATSPFYARPAYWCIYNTLKQAADHHSRMGRVPLRLLPYHVYVPTFGEWGFILMTHHARTPEDIPLHKAGQYLNTDTFKAAFVFPTDMGPMKTGINTLDKPILIDLHTDSWKKWNQ